MLLIDKLSAFAVIVIWGINFYFMKLAISDLDPMLVGCLRFVFVLFPFIFFIPKPKVAWRWLLLYGLISNFAQFAFMFSAIATGLATSLAALIVQSQAFFTVLIAVFLLGERAKINQWLAILIATIGFIFIGIGQKQTQIPFIGLICVFASALAWALGNIVVKKIKQTDPIGLVVWGNLLTPLWFVLLSIYQHDLSYVKNQLQDIHWQGWVGALFLAYFATIIGYGLWVKLLAKYPASKITPLSLGVPVISMLFAACFLDEHLNGAQWIGTVIVFLSLAVHLFGNKFTKKRYK